MRKINNQRNQPRDEHGRFINRDSNDHYGRNYNSGYNESRRNYPYGRDSRDNYGNEDRRNYSSMESNEYRRNANYGRNPYQGRDYSNAVRHSNEGNWGYGDNRQMYGRDHSNYNGNYSNSGRGDYNNYNDRYQENDSYERRSEYRDWESPWSMENANREYNGFDRDWNYNTYATDYDDNDYNMLGEDEDYDEDYSYEGGRGFATMDRDEVRRVAGRSGRASNRAYGYSDDGRTSPSRSYNPSGNYYRASDNDNSYQMRNGGRGFAAMDRNEERRIASKGGRASHSGRSGSRSSRR